MSSLFILLYIFFFYFVVLKHSQQRQLDLGGDLLELVLLDGDEGTLVVGGLDVARIEFALGRRLSTRLLGLGAAALADTGHKEEDGDSDNDDSRKGHSDLAAGGQGVEPRGDLALGLGGKDHEIVHEAVVTLLCRRHVLGVIKVSRSDGLCGFRSKENGACSFMFSSRTSSMAL